MAKTKPKNDTNSKDNGFIPIRRGLFEHIKMGLMKGRDIPTYVAIHFFADYETGVAYNVSAPFLANFLHEKPYSVRRSLRRLEQKGYIKRFGQRGGDPGYDIVIDKYLIQKCISISAAKSKSINEIAWTVTKDCTLTVNRVSIDCPSTVHRLSPIKEIKNIRTKEVNRGKAPSFTPPTAKEVREYAESIGFPELDAEYFCKHYAAADWKLKDGEKMKNWKLSVLTWQKNHEKYTKSENQEELREGEFAAPSEEVLQFVDKIYAARKS